MRFVIVAVGGLKDRALREVADDYVRRIVRHVGLDELEVREASALERATPRDATVVALEVAGEQLSSVELARRVERWGSQGKGKIAFLIGAAEGIPAHLSRAAHARLSLSSLTLPHRLARVLLLEQLYRSLALLRGEPYPREG